MNSLDDNLYVPRRTLEADFPRTAERDLETFCVTAKVAPVIKKSVYWKTTEMTPGQVCYTGITNPKSRETYSRWLKAYREREKESLPPVFAVQMRESRCCDSTQSPCYPSRWGDIPVPR
ncbi:tektin bundle-interacting protein 1-like [Scyliorhinus torazame]|uniref:tektin bundle-interacting protein 1-like n=1 Tax=Scyliorhinus torazame TaxID=75743 RepID=UPI003B5A6C56